MRGNGSRDVAAANELLGDAQGGRAYVAVIGIDRYRSWNRLYNAVSDASGALGVFSRLGFEHLIPISAEHGHGIGDLEEALSAGDRALVFRLGPRRHDHLGRVHCHAAPPRRVGSEEQSRNLLRRANGVFCAVSWQARIG
jgi:hypothetical protein